MQTLNSNLPNRVITVLGLVSGGGVGAAAFEVSLAVVPFVL